MSKLRPLPPPEPTRLAKGWLRLKRNPTKLTWIVILAFLALSSITYSLLVALNVFTPAQGDGFDSITAHAGYVANAERSLRASVLRFDRVIKSSGVTSTIVLTPSSVVLSSTISNTGDIDIVSNQNTLPHYIEYQGIKYRQLAAVVNTRTSLFDTPDAEIWTSDIGSYTQQANSYKVLSNPSNLLNQLLPNIKIDNAQLRKDGSTFIYASGSMTSVPDFLDKASKVGIQGRYHLYVTVSKLGLLTRIFLIYPDKSSILISVNPKVAKIVDKPDLTKVVPTLNLSDKTK